MNKQRKLQISYSGKIPKPKAIPGEIDLVDTDFLYNRQRENSGRRLVRQVSTALIRHRSTMGTAVTLGILVLCALCFFKPHYEEPIMTEETLKGLLDNIKGNDNRLFRWDATPLTTQRRGHGGCKRLPDAVSLLMAERPSASMTRTSDADRELKLMAAEYLTFCITDAPSQRALFGQQEGIHKAVVDLVSSKDAALSAMAAHLIYSSAFANEHNHQTYIVEGAVEALASVIMNRNSLTSQIMWASAALQNLGASYCSTADDGRCYWEWTLENSHVTIETDSLPMISDGIMVRENMVNIPGLIETLVQLACTGPVEGSFHEGNVFPGENTVLGRDDNNPHLVAWAATGALKNLALEPTAIPRIEPALQCMCSMKESPDWLEQHKANELILFLRREPDPCWYDETGVSSVCIDANFVDQEHYHCDAYKRATRDECENECVVTGVLAKNACCECGGGTRYSLANKDR